MSIGAATQMTTLRGVLSPPVFFNPLNFEVRTTPPHSVNFASSFKPICLKAVMNSLPALMSIGAGAATQMTTLRGVLSPPVFFNPLNFQVRTTPPHSVNFALSCKPICLKAVMNCDRANRAAASVGFLVRKPVQAKSKFVMAATTTIGGNELDKTDSKLPLALIVLKWMAKKVYDYVMANKEKVTSDMKALALSVLGECSDTALTFVYTVAVFVVLFLLVPGILNHVYYCLKVIRRNQTGTAEMEKLVEEHKPPLLFEGYQMAKLLVLVLGHLVAWVFKGNEQQGDDH